MSLKLITIDFWNTLFTTENSSVCNSARMKMLNQTLEDLEITIDQTQFDKVLNSSWQYYNDKWLNEMRTPTAREVLTYIWTEMAFVKNTKALDYVIDFFEKSILCFPPKMEPNAEVALQQLSQKYILGIVSDTGFSPGRVMTQLLEDIDIRKYFSGFSYSDETGVAKPHPKAFNTLLSMFDVNVEEALHIGDIERTDIAGAKGLGMKAIRYDGDSESDLIQSKNNISQADIILQNWDAIVDYLL